MDKVFEQILKYVPSDIVPAIITLAVVFFGVYYFKGIRSYTDALNDRTFLSLAVLIVGVFLVLQINKSDVPRIEQGTRPLLLVPRFENDVGRELETLFVTQLSAAIERSVKEPSILRINAYVRDRETAQLNAEGTKAVAILFEPKIVREGGNKAVLCFRLLFTESGRVTTFSAVSAEIEKMNLNELANSLVTTVNSTGTEPPRGDSVFSRLDALERRIGELSSSILKTTALIRPTPKEAYPTKRAVVIGVNYDKERRLPSLAFAASDATAMASVLKTYGFEVTLLLNEDATLPRIREATDTIIKKSDKNDLLLVFYAGASVRSPDLGDRQAKKLILPTYDLQLNNVLENLTLNSIVDQLRPASTLNRLIVLDGCHGTYGLDSLSDGGSTDSSGNAFQVIAASQDDQFAFELPGVGGGIFTQKLVTQLKDLADSGAGISTHQLIGAVTPDLILLSNGGQVPKLVTLSGAEDVVFARPR